MSGTSLDGLDLCLCKFTLQKKIWHYKIIKAKTIPYSQKFKTQLNNAPNLSGLDLMLLSNSIGNYYAKQINLFLKNVKEQPSLIASHGQTIFHQPNKQLTLQIGNGAIIAAKTKITTVCDFRTTDVALCGQGAPLVPIGDIHLFPEYDACLNLGGFANITLTKNNPIIAFDICAVNIVLNNLCEKIKKPFDKNGIIAKNNKVDVSILKELNKLSYYKKTPPKSLGKEWVDKNIFSIFNNADLSVKELIATYTLHAAQQIKTILEKNNCKRILVTGGGAFNTHLIDLIKKNNSSEITIPERETIAFKEALIFAFLGTLRVLEQPNALKQVTGAQQSNVGGAVYFGGL